MYLRSVLLSILLATSATAQDTKPVSEKSQCNKMRRLQVFIDLAANTTALQELTANNTARIASLQAEASRSATQLTELQSNATLVSDCAVINAAEEQEDQCDDMVDLQSFLAFAANATAVAEKMDNNATKIAAIQARVPEANTKLQTLMSNSTLQAACPAILQKEKCEGMKRLETFITSAANQTLMDEATEGNATTMEMIKGDVVRAENKLVEIRKNQTFLDACAAMGMVLGSAKAIDSTAQTPEEATGGKNAAVGVQVGRIQIAMLSTLLLLAAGMCTL